MKPARINIPPSHAGATNAGIDWFSWITHGAFLLAIVVVGARAMMGEMLRDPSDPTAGAAAAPGPATSLLLDLLCCLPGLLVLARRVLDRTYIVRLSWSHLPMALLAGWMALSVTWSADRFAAMVSAASFISALVVLWSMTQLVRSWARLRLAIAAIVGLLLVYVAAGSEYYFVELRATQREFYSDPARYLLNMGIEPGSFEATQFKNRLDSGGVGIFSTSPNTYAAVLVMMSVVAAGAMIQRAAHRDHWGWIIPFILTAPLAAVLLHHTQSRTAMALIVLAALLLAAVGVLRRWLATRSKLAFWLGAGIIALGMLAGIGHGLARGNLVEKSLTFRWYYWTGAARMLAEHPLRGVGWANFGLYYPAVRGPLAVEEVKDPHNFLVRAFAELGLVGGALMVAWIMRMWWELTRPVAPAAGQAAGPSKRLLLRLGGLAGAMAGLNLLAATDWSQPAFWWQLQAARAGVGMLLMLIGLAVVVPRELLSETYDDRPAPWLLWGAIVALGVFLLHNLIDFAMFETSALFIFALLAGSALGVRQPSAAGARRRTIGARVAMGTALVVWLFLGGLWIRTALAEEEAHAGDQAMRTGHAQDAAGDYHAAFEKLPMNAEYAMKAAQSLIAARAMPQEIQGELESAIQANPRAIGYRLTAARYELTRLKPDPITVEDALGEAIRLNPRSLTVRLAYAAAMEQLGDVAAAAGAYADALLVDDELPVNEPMRLSKERRREIQRKITELSRAALHPATASTTEPATLTNPSPRVPLSPAGSR